MYNQHPSEQMKAGGRAPQIETKSRYKQIQNHLYGSGSPAHSLTRDERESSMYLNNSNTKSNMPKLQNLNHAPNRGQMDKNVRNTHLRLDPIDNSSPPTNNRGHQVAASMQFQKGMLTPLDQNNSSGKYLPADSNARHSPSNNSKHKKAQQVMN